MTFRMYSVFDVKAAVYSVPFSAPNDQMAVRSFGDGCQDERSPWAKHPEDYSLHLVGQFDDAAGAVSPVSPVVFVAKAADFQRSTPALKVAS